MKGGIGMAEGSRRRIREQKPPSDDLILDFKIETIDSERGCIWKQKSRPTRFRAGQ